MRSLELRACARFGMNPYRDLEELTAEQREEMIAFETAIEEMERRWQAGLAGAKV